MEYLLMSLVVFGCITVHKVHGSYTHGTADNLYTALTFGSSITSRPSDVVNVSVTLTLDSLNYLDFNKQTFSAEGWITSRWEDLRWNWIPSGYDDIEHLFVPKANCWKPNLILDNELSNKYVLNDDNLVMRIKYDMTVTWEQPLVFNAHCKLDSTNFPFDKQKCYISIGTAGYDKTTVLLTHGASDVITTNLVDNAEWSLESTSLSTKERTDGSGLYTSTNLIFNFELKRNGIWYVVNLLVPLIVTSLLGLGVFLIPVESGEKIAYTSTLLVVNAILIGISSYFLPTSSVSAPVIGIHVFSIFILNGIEILLTIISIRMHNKHGQLKGVPLTTQILVKKINSNFPLCCAVGDDGQTHEIIDLTSEEKKRSNTLKKKFSMKSRTRVSPSPMPTPAGYERMQSGTDSTPSVDPELDGRTNLPSNSRYRPSSYTHMRPISQVEDRPSSLTHKPPPSQIQDRPSSLTHTQHPPQIQDRPSSYTSSRPMSMKSVGGIQLREKSFVSEDINMSFPTGSNHTNEHQEIVIAEQTPQGDTPNNVTDTANELNELERKLSEKSYKKAPSKGTSFRSNRARDEMNVTWTDVAHLFDNLCFVIMFFVVVINSAVITAVCVFN